MAKCCQQATPQMATSLASNQSSLGRLPFTSRVTATPQRCAGDEVRLNTGHLIACFEFYLNVRVRKHGVVAFEIQSLIAAWHTGVRVRIGVHDGIPFGGGHIAFVLRGTRGRRRPAGGEDGADGVCAGKGQEVTTAFTASDQDALLSVASERGPLGQRFGGNAVRFWPRRNLEQYKIRAWACQVREFRRVCPWSEVH